MNRLKKKPFHLLIIFIRLIISISRHILHVQEIIIKKTCLVVHKSLLKKHSHFYLKKYCTIMQACEKIITTTNYFNLDY
jgi:hypothetical protein